jgi:hypothetical protein
MSAHHHAIGANVSQRERAFLVEALELLMRERSNALRIATAVAKARGERLPDVRDFGLDDILRLSRQLTEGVSTESQEIHFVAQRTSKKDRLPVADGRPDLKI